jgi:hypothetical protein
VGIDLLFFSEDGRREMSGEIAIDSELIRLTVVGSDAERFSDGPERGERNVSGRSRFTKAALPVEMEAFPDIAGPGAG